MCLAFPDVYEVGMSYLGFQILYSLIKTIDHADVERVYCPWTDMEDAMRRSGVVLTSLESDRPLCEFDAVGFTLQYELCATNIVTMLDLGGIPIRARDRGDGDPIVFGGGPGALAPASVEVFFDAFMLGDGEETVSEVLACLRDNAGGSRERKLDALATIGGVYVPGVSRGRVRRRIVRDLDAGFVHRTMIVPSMSIIHDRAAVQVFRGCARGCRFCQAGMTDRPVRERSSASVEEQLMSLVESTGWEEAGLLSLATCDWSGLPALLENISPALDARGAKLSLPSLRVDAFSVELAARLETLRRTSLTFAPEAGSQRLRDVINKGVGDEDIKCALDAAFRGGWDRVKLYFMMGLPTETTADLEGIVDIANEAVHAARVNKRKGEVAVSLAGFVPKAHTPFQWEAQASRAELRERARYTKGLIKSRKISLAYHEPEQTYLEGVFARGTSDLGEAIIEAWRRGARFDGWSDTFDFERWAGVFRDLDIDADALCGARGIGDELPWDMIDVGVTRGYLARERDRAYEGAVTPSCMHGSCSACGWEDEGLCRRA